jgi:ParB family transcriptional regulator, chromosome partitioning protein
MSELLSVGIDQLMADPTQPRKTFEADALERLAASLLARGMLTPIRVIRDEERKCYLIATGESRWRAARLAGLTHVPCLVVEGELSEAEILADRLTENMVRQDLSPMDEAIGIARLKLLKGGTAKALAQECGFSAASITRAEALVSLPEEIQEMVGNGPGQVVESAAYEISRHPDPAAQLVLARAVASRRMTRDQVAEAVRSHVGKKNVKPKASRLCCRLDGGVSVTVSADGPLTWDTLLDAIERVRKEAKKLCDSGKTVTDFARSLRAS